MNKFIKYWLPPIAWMCLIFYLSSKHDVSVAEEFAVNFILLKTVHVIVYAILYFLFFRALYSEQKKKKLDESLLLAAFYTILYAASDELHQAFVPNRQGHIRDVIIDAFGIYIMFSYIKYNFKRIKQIAT